MQSTLKVLRSVEKDMHALFPFYSWIKNAFRLEKREILFINVFFNSLSSETRRENPGVVGAVPDLYFVESTECWQPETGGSVTVSKMCTILDDAHLSFLAGRYFLIFDGKENHLSYLKFSRANWPEAYLNYSTVIGLVNTSN